ncbi:MULTISPECIES: hypothetical protein [Nocardiopsis]|uniref:Uncharacterized protein n=1 Tax=Nocardiopsis sinuspersici TaxID=501010 RepID=A0A1V3C5Y9_9ACTN|nr:MULTISPECIES: hypothetical protein [Nocardiopsis]NYH52769.1 hypothetical protein [Nocardiopsis sinuspersici]OOC56187.1 hypothetical protein NOSIN_22100 [Nocardiopsis sinuspersici]
MARRTDRAPKPARSITARRHIRPSTGTRPSGLVPEPANVPQPREDADATISGHPIMHWVMVTDENGRNRPQVRWF